MLALSSRASWMGGNRLIAAIEIFLETLLRGLFNQQIGSLQPGPKLDETALVFTLKTNDGKSEITLSKVVGPKPVGRFYLIDHAGKVAFKNGRGPFGFKPVELDHSLILLLEQETATVIDHQARALTPAEGSLSSFPDRERLLSEVATR